MAIFSDAGKSCVKDYEICLKKSGKHSSFESFSQFFDDTEFDFDNDALQLKIDGDWLTAEGTTLGADNVNIALMTVGREVESNQNVILLNTDTRISKDLLAKVKDLVHVEDAMVLELPQHY